MSVLNLTTKRFERLERTQRETNERLGRMEETFTRAANTLDAHSDHFERLEEALLRISAGVDGLRELLVGAVTRNRTQDLARFDDHDRRLRALDWTLDDATADDVVARFIRDSELDPKSKGTQKPNA